MMLPHIQFRYSTVYDDIFKRSFIEEKEKYPGKEDIEKFMGIVEGLWIKQEKNILQTLAEITHLLWEEEQIICYVVGRTRALSDPLTIPAYKGNEDYAIDVITHELIHCIFTQPGNYKVMLPFWDLLEKKYKALPYNAWLHIPVEAVHARLYKKLFDDERMKRDTDFLSLMPDYKIAWEIAVQEGDAIIKEILSIRE